MAQPITSYQILVGTGTGTDGNVLDVVDADTAPTIRNVPTVPTAYKNIGLSPDDDVPLSCPRSQFRRRGRLVGTEVQTGTTLDEGVSSGGLPATPANSVCCSGL